MQIMLLKLKKHLFLCALYLTCIPNLFKMRLKTPDISTVIVVNKKQGSTKTLQVKTKHISRLKHYLLGVIGFFALLSAIIIYLDNKNVGEQKQEAALRMQISELKASMPVPVIDSNKKPVNAQTYIQDIEGKLQTINTYLSKRGLKGFSIKSVGGSGTNDDAKLTEDEKYSLYDEYLSRVLHAVAFTPMGYPRMSSLTSYFGYRSDPFDASHAEFHPGIDFKGERGDEAKCTANGKVVFAGWYGGYGNCVRIAHANNYETLYGHLSRISVKVGQEVTAGQKIGEVGSTGHSTGTHLHYEVRKDGRAINPISFLSLNSK
jgi:murein DD-endopeptidase MepM/ murein hydrolase activator NlpD